MRQLRKNDDLRSLVDLACRAASYPSVWLRLSRQRYVRPATSVPELAPLPEAVRYGLMVAAGVLLWHAGSRLDARLAEWAVWCLIGYFFFFF